MRKKPDPGIGRQIGGYTDVDELTIDSRNRVRTSTIGDHPTPVIADAVLSGNEETGELKKALEIDTIKRTKERTGRLFIGDGNATVGAGFTGTIDTQTEAFDTDEGPEAADDLAESIRITRLPLLEWLIAIDECTLLPDLCMEMDAIESGISEKSFAMSDAQPRIVTGTCSLPVSQEVSDAKVERKREGRGNGIKRRRKVGIGSSFRGRNAVPERPVTFGGLWDDPSVLYSFTSNAFDNSENEMLLHAGANDATTDRKTLYALPVGASLELPDTVCSVSDVLTRGKCPSSAGTASGTIDTTAVTTTSSDGAVVVSDLVCIGVTAGDIRLQWAQSDPMPCRRVTAEADSFIETVWVE